MWVVNRLGNVVVTAGHERPAGPFWDIAHTEVRNAEVSPHAQHFCGPPR